MGARWKWSPTIGEMMVEQAIERAEQECTRAKWIRAITAFGWYLAGAASGMGVSVLLMIFGE